MYSNDFRNLIKNQYREYRSYRKVAKLCGISDSTVKKIVQESGTKDKKKPGPKPKITERQMARIKREVSRISARGERVTSGKIRKECGLTSVSARTIRNQLRKMNYRYKSADCRIVLSKKHKDNRLSMAKQWIESNHRWSHVIFTDEKRFNLDGPDSWCSWMREESSITRQKRQQGGQSVQVWGMIMPGNIFLVFLLSQRSKSSDYIKFLKNYVKPLLDTYDSDDLIFQQDNASIHVSKSTLEWIEKSGIKTMRWPSKSPDLNIIENVWSILSSMVYDGPQFDNKDALWMKIQQCAEEINISKNDYLETLRTSMQKRLLAVIERKGDIIDY